MTCADGRGLGTSNNYCVNYKMLKLPVMWLVVDSPYLWLNWLFQVQTLQFHFSYYKQ